MESRHIIDIVMMKIMIVMRMMMVIRVVIIQTMIVTRSMIMETGKGSSMICDMINVKIYLATLKIVETGIVVEH